MQDDLVNRYWVSIAAGDVLLSAPWQAAEMLNDAWLSLKIVSSS